MKHTCYQHVLHIVHRYRYNRWALWCIAAMVIVAVNARAEPDAAPSADMHLKPRLCVRGTSAELCRLDVTIRWRGNTVDKYCLYSDKSLQPLRCWMQQEQGDTQDSVSIKQDLDYWLAWQVNNDELARKTLKVLTAKSEDRRRTRRRRHVWSVF